MSTKPTSLNLGQLLKGQLQDPVRLRFVVCAVLLIGWYFGHHAPATEHILATSSRTEAEKRRIATAQQVERLRKALAPFQSRIPRKEGQNEMIQYVMARVRRSPLKLVDLNPGRNDDLGSVRAIELKLKLEGSYADLDEFLNWVEHEHRLLRVDALKIQRKGPQRRGLAIEMDLLGLVDAPKSQAPEKGATKAAARTKDEKK